MYTLFIVGVLQVFLNISCFLQLPVLNYDDWLIFYMLMTLIRSRLQGRELKPFNCVQV